MTPARFRRAALRASRPRGPADDLATQEVRSLILEGERDGRILKPWSAEIKRDIAGGVMMALTRSPTSGCSGAEAGQARDPPLRPADGTLVYLAHCCTRGRDGRLAR